MRRAVRASLLLAADCAIAVPIAGCATSSSSPKARTAVDVADMAFARIQAQALVLLPRLPEPTAARVRIGLAIAGLALAAAHGTVDPADQEQQLRRAAGAIADIVEASRQR